MTTMRSQIMHRVPSSFALLTWILLSSAGCGHGHEDHGHAEHTPTAQEDHGSGAQLTLNGGEKWQVDEHTRESATKIAELVEGVQTLHSTSDAQALGKALDEELDTLVRRCTMTGPAHDQLHVFLVALFPKVETLKAESDLETLQLAKAEIGELLEAFASHFE